MKRLHFFKTISIVGILSVFAFVSVVGQNPSANAYLKAVYFKMKKAKDYTVDAHIKVDMPFIRMLPVNVKIFFKQKDKFKVESKSIALVPRQGFDQVTRVIADTNSYTALIQGSEMVENKSTYLINVIPLSDTSDIILGKFWVDPAQNLVLKMQLTSRTNGTIVTEFFYGSQLTYALPDKMIFTVDVKKFKIPKGIIAEKSTDKAEKETADAKNKKGKVFIELKNYQVNKGIADEVFKK